LRSQYISRVQGNEGDNAQKKKEKAKNILSRKTW
jgi:hypothetical protein